MYSQWTSSHATVLSVEVLSCCFTLSGSTDQEFLMWHYAVHGVVSAQAVGIVSWYYSHNGDSDVGTGIH